MNARELIAELDGLFATRTRAEWAERFDREPDLFWAPVNSIDDVVSDAQFVASGAVVEVPDERGALDARQSRRLRRRRARTPVACAEPG